MSIISGPRFNRRVTCDASLSNDRSESVIAANPLDPYNLVAASKKFIDPQTYSFTLGAYTSFDGGLSWTDNSLSLTPQNPKPHQPPWTGASDPALAWDNQGNVFLVALPFRTPKPGEKCEFPDLCGIGIAVYKSADGGRTWQQPLLIHEDDSDDKQCAAGDGNPSNPFYGNVYAAWDTDKGLAFARSTDHGATWKGLGNDPPGSSLGVFSFSPDLSVAADGTVYIFYRANQSIAGLKSTDGGNTFVPLGNATAASGLTFLESVLPHTNGWPHFPDATFRVVTIPTACTVGKNLAVAWADGRDGVSRIYYRRSQDGGNTWEGPDSGQPMLTGANASGGAMHDFHPQLACTPGGEIGCAFYEYGPTFVGSNDIPQSLIHVILAVSTDNGAAFSERTQVTDMPWDPAIDAPHSHGDAFITFIGEYFGLEATRLGFFPLWTDTRTGVQEIYTSRLAVRPAEVFIRDAPSDTGVPPTLELDATTPDIVVRNQSDGDKNFSDEDPIPGQLRYIYGRVRNNGPNVARNVQLSVVFSGAKPDASYPTDWFPGDWDASVTSIYLGTSAPASIKSGASRILGPIEWPANLADPFQYSLLCEVRADNDDSAGGPLGGSSSFSSFDCNSSSLYWENNNITVRSQIFHPITVTEYPNWKCRFFVGWCPKCPPGDIGITLDTGPELYGIPLLATMSREGATAPGSLTDTVMGASATVPPDPFADVTVYGGTRVSNGWSITKSRGGLAFRADRGERREITLSGTVPRTLKPGMRTSIRVMQRNKSAKIAGVLHITLSVAGTAGRS